jgi:hypothetical protein
MDGPGERLARRTVVIAFLAQALDPGLERGGLLAQLDLTGGGAVVRPDLGVEQVLEVFVLVGELVMFQPGLCGKGDDVQRAGSPQRLPRKQPVGRRSDRRPFLLFSHRRTAGVRLARSA